MRKRLSETLIKYMSVTLLALCSVAFGVPALAETFYFDWDGTYNFNPTTTDVVIDAIENQTSGDSFTSAGDITLPTGTSFTFNNVTATGSISIADALAVALLPTTISYDDINNLSMTGAVYDAAAKTLTLYANNPYENILKSLNEQVSADAKTFNFSDVSQTYTANSSHLQVKKDGRCQKQQPHTRILFQLFVMATTS